MPRKPRVQRTPEEKWQIVLEGLKSGNVAETCRKYEIAPNLYYRWKDEVEAGSQGCAWGEKRSRAAGRRAGRSDQAAGAGPGPVALADRDTKKRAGRVSCGQAHSQATRTCGPRQGSKAGGRDAGDQPLQSLLPRQRAAAAPIAATTSEIVAACGEKAGLRLSPRGLVAGAACTGW